MLEARDIRDALTRAVPIHYVPPVYDLQHESAGRDYFFGSLWIPISNMYFERGDVGLRKRVLYADDDPGGWGGGSSTRAQMTRIAIGLRLWLRRAIKRINDRYVAWMVEYLRHARAEIAVSEMEIG